MANSPFPKSLAAVAIVSASLEVILPFLVITRQLKQSSVVLSLKNPSPFTFAICSFVNAIFYFFCFSALFLRHFALVAMPPLI